MKKFCLAVFMFLMICGVCSAMQKANHEKWLTMVGYGASWRTDSDLSGTGGALSVVYLPHHFWGFGLDAGTNYTKGKDLSGLYGFQTNQHIGPSIYLFPLNTRYHRVYISIGGNVFHYCDIDVDEYRRIYDDPIHRWDWYNVGLNAGVGYSVKFLRHFELGIRGYASFIQEGFYLKPLVNLSVSF